jgi:hypothetical protein
MQDAQGVQDAQEYQGAQGAQDGRWAVKPRPRTRKPRLPRVDWLAVVKLLAGPVAEAEAKGPSEAPGHQVRLDHGKARAGEGCECSMPPRG